MKNVLLKIAYDGSSFHGWQRQPNLLTVQGEIERVISILCAEPIRIVGPAGQIKVYTVWVRWRTSKANSPYLWQIFQEPPTIC